MRTVEMKEIGMPLRERFKEFPWMLMDLVFPFMMEYLVRCLLLWHRVYLDANHFSRTKLAWYLIWETILNILAELTCFADRSFYDAWWNSSTSPKLLPSS